MKNQKYFFIIIALLAFTAIIPSILTESKKSDYLPYFDRKTCRQNNNVFTGTNIQLPPNTLTPLRLIYKGTKNLVDRLSLSSSRSFLQDQMLNEILSFETYKPSEMRDVHTNQSIAQICFQKDDEVLFFVDQSGYVRWVKKIGPQSKLTIEDQFAKVLSTHLKSYR